MSIPAMSIRPEKPIARHRRAPWLLAGLVLLALQGCGRGADSGATANPVAPGSPGTSAPTVQGVGRGESVNESPGTGGSTLNVPPGISGSGTGTTSEPAQPGRGTDGGLAGSGAGPGGSAGASYSIDPAAAASGAANAVKAPDAAGGQGGQGAQGSQGGSAAPQR